jgi:uncharacterized repeat protein (TIGR01451 family)
MAGVSLIPGGTATFTVTANISASATGTLVNTASVVPPAGVTDPNPGNNTATDTDSLTPQVDVGVTKTDGTTSAVPGLSTTYTIVVANAGPSTATNVAVSDPLPVGVTGATWSGNSKSNQAGALIDAIAVLARGASVTYTLTVQINASATGLLLNTVTIAAANDTHPGNNTATDTDTLTSPTNTPTNTPTSTPTNRPTNTPTNTPTSTPTNTPTSTPTSTPSGTPTPVPVVPTLNESGMLIFGLLIAAAGLLLLVRRR